MVYNCDICDKEITEKVAKWSERNLGKMACFDCQNKKSDNSDSKPVNENKGAAQLNGQSVGMAVKAANAIIIAKTPDSVLSALKPTEWAKNVIDYTHALLEEMTKRGL